MIRFNITPWYACKPLRAVPDLPEVEFRALQRGAKEMTIRQRRKLPDKPLEVAPAQAAKYKSRMDLEDAIEDYARAYAGLCMHKSSAPLTQRAHDRMMDAIEAHELAIAKGDHAAEQG